MTLHSRQRHVATMVYARTLHPSVTTNLCSGSARCAGTWLGVCRCSQRNLIFVAQIEPIYHIKKIRRADAQNSRAKNAMSLLLVTISLSLAVPAGGSLVFISQPNGQAPIAPLRRVLSKIPYSTFQGEH